MSTVSTEGLNTRIPPITHDQINNRLRYVPLEDESSADCFNAVDENVYCRPYASRQGWPLVAAVVTALGTIIGGESSRRIHPLWATMMRQMQDEEVRVAGFFQPVDFAWNRDVQRARLAAREFSEQTDADY